MAETIKSYLHQTDFTIADFDGVFKYLENIIANDSGEKEIHVFPELFLCGYPLQDLVLQRPFVAKYVSFENKLEEFLKSQKASGQHFIIGGLSYDLDESGTPKSIKNSIIYAQTGKALERPYHKRLLPNYDIFDEKKYFHPGTESTILDIDGFKLGLLICEDIWMSSIHLEDPVEDLYKKVKKEKVQLDAVISINASPFNLRKGLKRHERGHEIAQSFNAPFMYTNKVGGEDEIIFDGQSFVMFPSGDVIEGLRFQRDVVEFQINKSTEKLGKYTQSDENTWEGLFSAAFSKEGKDLRIQEWSDQDFEDAIDCLIFGVQEYAKKCGFKKFEVALSGGMDSCLVLTLLRMGLREGQTIEAIYMPGPFSASLSYDLSFELCQNLGVPMKTLPIKFLYSTCKTVMKDAFGDEVEGLTSENLQSRLRGLMLYGRSNQNGSMVVNTSNKSELAVGYSTQYGDSVGAISMLGDLYKTEVYWLAKYINRKYNNIIPEGVITRPPSAELREDQKDSDSLPPYEILDAILEGILSFRMGKEELIKAGIPQADVERVFGLYSRTEFKRYQFCPIIKLKSKSFGFGYRIPITKDSSCYQ